MRELIQAIESRLDECMLRDARRLQKRLGRLKRARDRAAELARLEKQLEQSMARARSRAAQPVRLDYPEELPVSERRDDIREAIESHQVVIVAGETGSGKTTQLPKICMELGLGIRGTIGHTQPRRVAARSTAARIAEETGTELGQLVGYRVRFADRVSDSTRVKLLTDGMLLAESQSDRDLLAYDTLIIDEAHERSLNIDFLLGYLRRLMTRRPELKIIITSATLDTERFSKHFADAPVIEVSGRTWPVELRYRPLGDPEADEEDLTLSQGIARGLTELWREGPGDVLVFLPGEREIRDAADYLGKQSLRNSEILPLYGRLSSKDQDRVFHPDGRSRRVILATNVAETSLTVPGIRYVIDSGLVRLSRYSYRSKVQRLPIEGVSQASANQRSGRCGRLGPGICIRLYSEEDFESRPAFTEPEIQRSNLASVILQMRLLKLGDPDDFPFVDPPEEGLIRDGFRLLEELRALDERRQLTEDGRRMARLPVDPRQGRMLLEAGRLGSLAEVLVIVAALSIQDPRERPSTARQAADECHAVDSDPRSDFLALFNLWQRYRRETAGLSRNQRRKWARRQFLAPMRMEEWGDLLRQLRLALRDMGLKGSEQAAEYPEIHRALLSGLLTQVGRKGEGHAYEGPRGQQFWVFPGSGLFQKSPKWLMAAELVQTSRTFARTVAGVEPQWIEQAAGHIVKREYFEPHWQAGKGRVAAYERVSLFGLDLVAKRRINFGRVRPQEAREVFLREGLVAARLPETPAFLSHNQRLIEEVRELEAKRRRRDLLREEEELAAFYDRAVPADIHDWPGLRAWLKKQGGAGDKALRMRQDDVMAREVESLEASFPDHVKIQGIPVAVDYHFEPGGERDGATLELPLALINQISQADLDWMIPGWRTERATALIRSLPKALRRQFVPAPDFAGAALDAMQPGEPMKLALGRQLQRMSGTEIPQDAWRDEQVPDYLHVVVRLVDGQGRAVDEGSDLSALQARHGHRASESLASAESDEWPRRKTRHWDFGRIPNEVAVERHGVTVTAWPALRDTGSEVELVLHDDRPSADALSHGGIRRLVALRLKQQADAVRKLKGLDRIALRFRKLGDRKTLEEALLRLTLDEAVLDGEEQPRDEAGFEALCRQHSADIIPTGERWRDWLETVMKQHDDIRRRLSGRMNPVLLKAAREIGEQLDYLIFPGFLDGIARQRLSAYPRYLQAVEKRLDRLEQGNPRDQKLSAAIRPHQERLRQRFPEAADQCRHDPDSPLLHYRWMVEEYRVSLFAQELGTDIPVSAQRLDRAWANY
ncbi:ATP-dependent RNA helicase HrpA [Natronospira bacteriovora]|uniref:ATP-dependent RNA helicase HrpA n=1 Tax=Natronospira bacteriovora TaxID=3069753 RepID=A0ABU0W9R3_9GAMM|nr:ATP-dependent RNA helicase HrpA [Natronospira sp. AB-CW4]MDQ2070774.1 ATP-dependent RNA helicase HrpA [Natronospira sp. AB-CW4]